MSRQVKIQLYLGGVPATLVLTAAQSRGLSVSAYARMALLGQIRSDLPDVLLRGMDVEKGDVITGQQEMVLEREEDASDDA